MDEVEQLLSDQITVANSNIRHWKSITSPRDVKQRFLFYWEGELTNAENRLSEYRLKKEEKRSNVLPFVRPVAKLR